MPQHHTGSKFRSHSATHGTNSWFTKQGPSRTAQPAMANPAPSGAAAAPPPKPTEVPSSQTKPNAANVGEECAASSKPNYKESGSEFSLRIDPETRQGPMSVDMTGMKPTGGLTKYGHPKNKVEFWKVYNEKYPGKLSEKNLQAILKKDSPIIDHHWLQHFPEHQKFLGQTIEHHHIDHGALAYPLPEKLHRGKGNTKTWHE